MISVKFPEVTHAIGEGQPQYQTLHAYIGDTEEREVTVCFELTDEEIAEIVTTKRIWHTQLTFKHPYQPVKMSLTNPFI